MEPKYIVAIVVGGIFFIMLVTYVIFTVRIGYLEKLRRSEIEKMYSDKNLVKMDYDFAIYDEETAKLLAENERKSGQLTIDDVLADSGLAVDESVFGTIDSEGLEEITGNYKPE